MAEADQIFIRGCSDSLAILEKAIRLTRSTHEEVQPVVIIGHSPYANPSLIPSFLSIQLPLYPGFAYGCLHAGDSSQRSIDYQFHQFGIEKI